MLIRTDPCLLDPAPTQTDSNPFSKPFKGIYDYKQALGTRNLNSFYHEQVSSISMVF
jgi:hypothetical protein